MKLFFSVIFLFLVNHTFAQSHLEWRKLSEDIFEEARVSNKYVLLNLEANWCHWCHVMHDSTYANQAVIEYLNEHYIAVSADQDAYPELSIRYKEYGWPATIVLNSKGEDIVKRSGYISATYFLKLLKAIVADPSPEEMSTSLAKLENVELKGLNKRIVDLDAVFKYVLDYNDGGFTQNQKYIAWDTYEYALSKRENDSVNKWISRSVKGAYSLVDSIWGGVSQYSTHGDWQHIHFEKLLSIQSRYLQIFGKDYLYNGNQESLEKVNQINAYIKRFLKLAPGRYANAQDADLIKGEHAEEYYALNDSERVKLGIPAIDSNVYTQRNAQLIVSFLKTYYLTNDRYFLKEAQQIMKELTKREANNSLYFHAEAKRPLFSLKDQIAVGEALVELTKNEGNYSNIYFDKLTLLLNSISRNYIQENGSALSYIGENGLNADVVIEENIDLARLLNWYGSALKNAEIKEKAQNMLNFLLLDDVVNSYYNEPGILLLYNEINASGFQYLTLDGGSKAFITTKAFAPFNSFFLTNEKENLSLEKQDLFEGLDKETVLACTDNYCSAPMYNTKDVKAYFKKMP